MKRTAGPPLVTLIAFLLTTSLSHAQANRGGIYGTVVDHQSHALPGVTVELTGIGANKVRITDEHGAFHFVGMDPGAYSLKATLDGRSVEHPRVVVAVNRDTTLRLQLTPAVDETITVTAESPLLDPRKIRKGTTITRVELEKIPTARDPWATVTQTPGVLSDRVNVAGIENEHQSAFVAPGTGLTANTYSVDGVDVTDTVTGTISQAWYDFDQLAEIQVSTGGSDVEKRAPGAAMNLVTKRGTDTPRGSGRYYLADGDELFGLFEQGTPSVAGELENGDGNGGLAEQTLESTPGNTTNEILDFGFEAGGPIVRQRLWAWASWGRNDIEQLGQTGDPENTLIENTAVKLNAQLGRSSSAVASWSRGDKIKDGRRGTSNLATEATWDQDGPGEVWKLEGTHTVTSSFYVTGLYAVVDGGAEFQSKGGAFPSPAFPTTDSATALANGETTLAADGLWHNGWYSGVVDRDSENLQLDGGYFFTTGSVGHELKFGASYRSIESESAFGWPGGRNNANLTCEAIGTCGFFTGVLGFAGDDLGIAWRSGFVPVELDYTAAWLQDTLTWGNLTLNVGLRYDLQEGDNPAATIPGNPLFPTILPEVVFAGNDGGGFDFETVSPRLGATWAFGADRRTLLRASYSRFAAQLVAADVVRVNPAGHASLSYAFDDADGDGVYEAGDPFTFLGTSGFDPSDPTSGVTPNQTDPGLRPALTDEVILAAEHAILPELVVEVDVTYRLTSEIPDELELIVDESGTQRVSTASDYVFDHTVTSDGVTVPHLPDCRQWSADYHTYRPGVRSAGGTLLTNGDREVEYLGYGVSFTKRLAGGWMARGHVQYGEAEWNVPASALARGRPPMDLAPSVAPGDRDGELFAPRSGFGGPFANTYIQSTWSTNVNGMVQVAPDEPWGFNLAANVFWREGYSLPYSYEAPTADAVGTRWNVQVVPALDSYRADDLLVADLRIEKEMPFAGELIGTFSLDVFNLFDESTVTARETQLDEVQANWVERTLSPRIYRLGFRVGWR